MEKLKRKVKVSTIRMAGNFHFSFLPFNLFRKADRLNRLLPFQNLLVQVVQRVGLLEGMVRLLVAVLR